MPYLTVSGLEKVSAMENALADANGKCREWSDLAAAVQVDFYFFHLKFSQLDHLVFIPLEPRCLMEIISAPSPSIRVDHYRSHGA
jgi:hypothetical protein